jgi:hypothetical protein
MKKIILAFLSLSILAFAVDYSSMSITDLQSLRGTVPTQDRAAFQSAMQSKMSTATADERAAMRQSKSGTASGTGNKYQKGKNR